MGLIPGTSDEAKGTSDYAMFPVIALRKADLDTETGVFSIVDVTKNYTVKMSYFSSEQKKVVPVDFISCKNVTDPAFKPGGLYFASIKALVKEEESQGG